MKIIFFTFFLYFFVAGNYLSAQMVSPQRWGNCEQILDLKNGLRHYDFDVGVTSSSALANVFLTDDKLSFTFQVTNNIDDPVTVLFSCSNQSVPVTVTFANGLYVFSFGENTFSVSAQTGGRIISYTCRGKELLIPSSVHSENYGATLWPSPQSNWGWPPYPVLDIEPYEAVLTGDTLTLVSRPDLKSGYHFRKKFYITPEDASINIIYSITNISESAKQVAAWDVCRTSGGVSFFPVDAASASLPSSNLMGVTIEDGICWYSFHPELIPRSQKLFFAAKKGWLAHVYDGMLFIKTFPDIPVDALPPQQGEVEIYAHSNGLYIELENHGEYTLLQPGETLVYPQKWYLMKIKEANSRDELLRTVRKVIRN